MIINYNYNHVFIKILDRIRECLLNEELISTPTKIYSTYIYFIYLDYNLLIIIVYGWIARKVKAGMMVLPAYNVEAVILARW